MCGKFSCVCPGRDLWWIWEEVGGEGKILGRWGSFWSQIASSLKGSSQPHKATKGKEKKKKVKDDDDEEYEPEEDEGEQVSGSSSEENEDRKDEDFAIENASGSRKRKVGRQNSSNNALFYVLFCGVIV